jgi:hypothetical protein
MGDSEWEAFFYGFGLDQVRMGFRAAIEGCDKRANDAQREYEAYIEKHSSFEEDSPEHYQSMDLLHTAWSADNAKIVIREAFILSALHYWERRMRALTNCKGYGFEKLEKKSQELGYPTAPKLTVVNTLCNLLKHENSKFAHALGSDWPDLFKELPNGPEDKTEWVLAIKDHHVEEVFDIVARSGPQAIDLLND